MIGGGVSGGMTVSHLLRSGVPVHITVFDKESSREPGGRPWWGGVAYGTPAPWHSINVPSMGMQAVESLPDHLTDWLQQKREKGLIDGKWGTTNTHIPRGLYGEYVAETVDEAKAMAHPESRLVLCEEEVTSLRVPRPKQYEIRTEKQTIRCDTVVLCTGNFSPSNLRLRDMTTTEENAFYRTSQRYIQNPWKILKDAAPITKGSTSIALIGSRLTAVDILLSLQQAGYQGKVHVISRKGLFPRENHAQKYPPAVDVEKAIFAPILGAERARFLWKNSDVVAGRFPMQDGRGGFFKENEVNSIFSRIIQLCDEYEKRGEIWQGVLDSLRPMFNNLWYLLSLSERQIFLTKWRDEFEVRRHRVAPDTFATLKTLFQRTEQHRGAVVQMKHATNPTSSISITLASTEKQAPIHITADWVINCTGPQIDFRKGNDIPSVLFGQLVEENVLLPEGSGIGLCVNPVTGRALSGVGNGVEESGVFAVGPVRRGTDWETIAIREIRSQSAAVAAVVQKAHAAKL